MSSYVLGEDVEVDLDEIWQYIARDSIDAADQWMDTLFALFEAIGKSPGIGHTRSDLTTQEVLFSAVGAYVIVYRTVAGIVQVIAVTQGGRDVPVFVQRRFSRQ